MKKINGLFLLVFISLSLFAQEDGKLPPGKGRINVQLVAGILNSTPVGIDAKSIRDNIKTAEANNPNFNGGLLPKTSAHIGFNIDYQFHKVGAIGTGVTYTPKGYWLFSNNTATDVRNKTFITVDYFEIPFFYKEYFKNNKMSLRFGPVLNLTVISKERIITKIGDEKEKEKYRLGEDDSSLPLPREIVPGFEAAFSYGNMAGLHGDIQFQYMGSMFKDDIDLRSIVFKVGVGYTFSK